MCQMLIQTFYSALSQRHKLASQVFAMPQEEPLILRFQPATTPCSQFRRSEALSAGKMKCQHGLQTSCVLIIGFMPHLL